MKLWDRGGAHDDEVHAFTVGDDQLLDERLVRYDCEASIAHARMLAHIGLLEVGEADSLEAELRNLIALHARQEFGLDPQDEDCHSAIERHLTERLGVAGKKIHLGRSRNDQVLVALRLYEKDALASVGAAVDGLGEALAIRIAAQGEVRIPGYTHMQKAMPSSVGMWLGSYRDALQDDQVLLGAVRELLDQNPLGTAAGFGVPVFALDRGMTTKALGFSRVQANPMYAQLSRGKLEASVLHGLSQVMLDVNRLASDLLLFTTVEFGFVSLPASLCTGSSIMPQKKNADALELVRGQYHAVLGLQWQVQSLLGNLMSGYNRDVQLTKGPVMRGLDVTRASVRIMSRIVSELQIDEARCQAAMTEELYATQQAYELVRQGVPFRDAYRRMAERYKE
ncbi:MAG: argininosuccinate lyase [Polyangiaceae bacterium]|jgi:argininosuccinate lyase|nr:argininosuccinate lyase [Polyangiaceae bacterium]